MISNITRFNRGTKAFSRDIESIKDSMYIYMYRNKILSNPLRYTNLRRVCWKILKDVRKC